MISQEIFNHFSGFHFRDPACERLWRKILEVRDPFASVDSDVLGRIASVAGSPASGFMGDFEFEKNAELSGHYVPIQAFRMLDWQTQSAKLFMSSGTTTGVRSKATFSPEGLGLYRAVSTYTFLSVLAAKLSADLPNALGACLIPPISEAPNSSLAQMLSWIGEIVPFQYVTSKNIRSWVMSNNDKAIWIFGTSAHWNELIHSEIELSSNKPIVAFETGGNKSLKQLVTDTEKLLIFRQRFGVAPTNHIFEYGMAELASQAYSATVDGGLATSYRFPWWVKTAVANALTSNQKTGRGALVLRDAARTDVPWPIRTQDDVTINGDGTFVIHGRRNGAVLKGCSIEFST